MPEGDIAAFCERHHVLKLALFGSVIRQDFRPGSDVDVLVEFVPGKGPGLIGMAGMEQELSSMIGGRRVDLRTPAELSPYFRDHVVAEARAQYAGA